MIRLPATALAALLLGSVWAQTLRIDDSGGPLTLREDVAAAIAAWREASGEPLGLAISDDGAVLVRYADTPLGPDTLSLTLQTPVAAAAPEIEIRLNPDRYRASPSTLLHELGVLLGLLPNDDPDSVMRPAVGSESPSLPSSSDIERLTAVRDAIPEDVNRDGAVDFYDLAALGEAFGSQGINLPADIDRNGTVDGADLAILEAAYTFGEPSPVAPPSFAPPGTDPLAPLPAFPPEQPDGDPTDGSEGGDEPTSEEPPAEETPPGETPPEESPPGEDPPEETPPEETPPEEPPADPEPETPPGDGG